MLMETDLAPDWFESPLGVHLAACEQAYFDSEVADVFGFNAFQIGLTRFDFLRANRMPLRCRIGPHGPAQVRAELEQLPILESSADLVLLPHVLEFSDNPHQVLREVARVLMPEGHVIVSGFNPWSLWGARRYFGKDRGEYPWRGQFITLPRLKDWMALLGFDISAGRMCGYVPPLRREKWLERLAFMEHAGDRWWPVAGGVYVLHGIKRVQGTRLITPRWKADLAKSKRLAPVPHRVHDQDRLVARSRTPRSEQ
ncbi:MAG: class I SAM-dependent methyltransferase [Burkholderiales bacterium]|nr:class I SAM-dependent methyltransferase [Burkholderiales bacterium]